MWLYFFHYFPHHRKSCKSCRRCAREFSRESDAVKTYTSKYIFSSLRKPSLFVFIVCGVMMVPCSESPGPFDTACVNKQRRMFCLSCVCVNHALCPVPCGGKQTAWAGPAERELVWATSWGVTTRLIGAMVMTHSDDLGLRLPPAVAPKQVALAHRILSYQRYHISCRSPSSGCGGVFFASKCVPSL